MMTAGTLIAIALYVLAASALAFGLRMLSIAKSKPILPYVVSMAVMSVYPAFDIARNSGQGAGLTVVGWAITIVWLLAMMLVDKRSTALKETRAASSEA